MHEHHACRDFKYVTTWEELIVFNGETNAAGRTCSKTFLQRRIRLLRLLCSFLYRT